MFLYNEQGDKAYAEKEQLEILLENGWSKTPPKSVKKTAALETDVEVEDDEIIGEDETESDEVDESTEVGEEAAPKKIGKKTIQKKK